MNISEKDKTYVWHPFTHLKWAEEPINIVRTEGLYYYDDRGNKIMDAISSWWVNLHGHCHPYISQKVSEQLKVNEHSIFSGFTHPNAVELAERLVKVLPENIAKIFYSDNGSTAVEVAIKMCLQYWNNQSIVRNKFIAFENAYHGDTFGGMSVGERNVFNNAFKSLLFDVIRIPVPTADNVEYILSYLNDVVSKNEIAGFIYEPLVQGAAGMVMYDAEQLNRVLKFCKEQKIICIADEVMTGFGRTGTLFAQDQLEHKADIICLSKGLTGGYMPLGVTACADFIYEAFVTDDKTKTFFHGHSYTANPTTCAAALASLDLLLKPESKIAIDQISNCHKEFLAKVIEHPSIRSINACGTILAIELKTNESRHYLNKASESISEYFIKHNILLRPLGNVLYILPPYCITKEELDYIYTTVIDFLNAYIKG